MKLKALIIFNLISISFCLKANSQDTASGKERSITSNKEIKIDPRQYATVQYRKSLTQGRLDTIWNWEQRRNVPNQKVGYLDIDGEITINFLKKELAGNKDFEGTVSLEAEISGANGTRKIEVNPYSEIGKERRPVGVKSEPPGEVAKKLLNMLQELEDAEETFEVIEYQKLSPDIIVNRQKFFTLENSLVGNLKKVSPADNIELLFDDAIDLQDLFKQIYPRFLQPDFVKRNSSAKVLLDSLKRMGSEFRYNDESYFRFYRDRYEKAFKYTQAKVGNVIEYFNSFVSAGEDTYKAFLSLINKDPVNYKFLMNTLNKYQVKLSTLSIGQFTNTNERLNSFLLENQELIWETSKFLSEISKFNGSKLEKIIIEISQNSKNNKIDINTYTDSDKYGYKNKFYKNIDEFGEQLAEIISNEAARFIYRRLVMATIDLGKSGAKDGEVLNVYITWILGNEKDTLQPRLPIGKYYLRETGWNRDVTDMFSLVKRFNEANINQDKVSPSNFKGAGGAVLVWTYRKEDKGVKITEEENNQFKVTRKNRLINFFEPSIGLNISYLDFSTEKDVEIGTGLQLGLFRNKIFFGYGINLHMISPKGQSPNYFYLGFSFAKISELFKNSGNISSVQ